MPINRHFRFDNDNPRYKVEDDTLVIDMGKMHTNADRYPIDFYLSYKDVMHIIPVEALKLGKMPLEQVSRWQIRNMDELKLPARFRARFGRVKNVVGLPMT
jgi:hypothetical protein